MVDVGGGGLGVIRVVCMDYTVDGVYFLSRTHSQRCCRERVQWIIWRNNSIVPGKVLRMCQSHL